MCLAMLAHVSLFALIASLFIHSVYEGILSLDIHYAF